MDTVDNVDVEYHFPLAQLDDYAAATAGRMLICCLRYNFYITLHDVMGLPTIFPQGRDIEGSFHTTFMFGTLVQMGSPTSATQDDHTESFARVSPFTTRTMWQLLLPQHCAQIRLPQTPCITETTGIG